MPTANEKLALTERFLRSLTKHPPEPGKRRTVWDSAMPGLAVRVTDKGHVSFYAVRRLPGALQPTWALLGRYPVVTLAAAREAARAALCALGRGEDPRQRAAPPPAAPPFAAVAEKFIDQHVSRLRTFRATEAIIRRELLPELGELAITDVRRRDIIKLVDAIVARGAPRPGVLRPKSGGEHAARHALAVCHKLFSWAVSKAIIETNPCTGVVTAVPEARSHVLSDDEIRVVWQAAEHTGYPYGSLVKVLLLTGQRLREVSEARRSEIDGRFLIVPAERMKGGTAHVLPLTDRVRALLDELPHGVFGDFIFSNSGGRRPLSGYSKLKARFDQTVAALGQVRHFRLHDLRRTMRTGLSSAGVDPFTAELIISHRQSGVQAVYDLHRYDDQKRAGLEKWEKQLFSILKPNVVELLRQRANR